MAQGVRALLLALAAAPAAACPLAAPALQAGDLQLAWQAEGGPIAVGRPFVMQVQLCPAGARLLRVDATMPEHRHGMNYRPSVAAQPDGRWRAEGLLWHMPGRWELRFDVEHGGRVQSLRESVTLR